MRLSRRGFVAALAGTAALTSLGGNALSTASITRDIAVFGGGVGGVAAALAALRNGRTVVLTESTNALGGQFSTQLVPPDEHYWIENSKGGHGRNESYQELRTRVRDSYKQYRPVTDAFKASNEPNPGNAWVSRISAEPFIWARRMEDMLKPYIESGKLIIIRNTAPASATLSGNSVSSVTLTSGERINAMYFIDSTELGDLLPIVGANYTIGREANTGELHNNATTPDPEDQQGFTWVAALGYSRHNPGDHRIPKPPNYDSHKSEFDHFFSENLFDPTRDWSWDDGPNYWQYRRVVAQSNFTAPVEEVSLINYHCNDYLSGNILGVSDAERQHHLNAAKNLTRCLVYYLQNDIPRKDGTGNGYPGLRLASNISETADGFAAAPYIREARRLVSIGRVWEWHVGVEARPNHDRAAQFTDSVGTGHYWLDVHAGPKFPNGLWQRCYTYQIPLMALIPNNRTNVLAGGKCLGVSHIVNGAYRLHPTEWNTGEAAGFVAHAALAWGKTPEQIRSQDMELLQSRLALQGIKTEWPNHLQTKWQD